MSSSSRTLLAFAFGCCFALGAPAVAEAPPGRYTIHDQGTDTRADDTVTDNRTGLVWQREAPNAPTGCPDTSCTHSQAIAYCNGLQLANGGWRLPKMSELLSLVDATTYDAAIDGAVFPNTANDFFWSASAYAGNSSYSWAVFFYDGTSDYYLNLNYARVRCVR